MTELTEPDQVVLTLLARAAVLPPHRQFPVDELIGDVASSSVPDYALKPLAAAIAKASCFDQALILKRLQKARGAAGPDGEAGEPAWVGPFLNWPFEPAVEPLSLLAAANEIADTIRLRVHCPDAAVHIAVLFVLLTYCYKAAGIAPRFILLSASPRSGKTTFGSTIAAFSYRTNHPHPGIGPWTDGGVGSGSRRGLVTTIQNHYL